MSLICNQIDLRSFSHVPLCLLILVGSVSLGCDDPSINEATQVVRVRVRDAESTSESQDRSWARNEIPFDLGATLADFGQVEPMRDADLHLQMLDESTLDQQMADFSVTDAQMLDLTHIDHDVRDAQLMDTTVLDAPMLGPAEPGTYTYTTVPVPLTNPPAVTWHPGGLYALVLNNKNTVHRFRDHSVEEAASAGDMIRWHNITFTPSGDHAILLATYTPDNQGRIYLWNHQAETLSELVEHRFNEGRYENLEYDSDQGYAKLLGTKTSSAGYFAYLWDFDLVTGRSNLSVHPTSARCEDLAWVRDSFGVNTVAITCGHNGADLYHLDQAQGWVRHRMNAGNTSYVSSRPQGDYALAVTDTSHKLYRFEGGIWRTEFSSPFLPGSINVEFSTDGRRALIFGGIDPSSGAGQIYEYRHDFYLNDEIFPVFTSQLTTSNTVYFNDVSWRPHCEQGLIVGGGESLGSRSGFLIQFTLDESDVCDSF